MPSRALRLSGEQHAALIRGKPLPKKRGGEQWEFLFAAQLAVVGIQAEREHRFFATRKWRFDFAIPEHLVAVEIEGGAHAIKRQQRSDREKSNAAVLLGWRVLRVGPDQVRSGEALSLLQQLLQTVHVAAAIFPLQSSAIDERARLA